MNNKNNNVVYLHKNEKTKEVFYVGIGNPSRPWYKYRSQEWKDYTKENNYSTHIVASDLSRDEAESMETSLIKQYGRKDLGLGLLINKTDGGAGLRGYVWSDKTKEYRSKRMVGNTIALGLKRSEEDIIKMRERSTGKNNPNYGKTISDEHKKAISIARRRTAISDERYALLLKDIERRLNGGTRCSRIGLASEYNVSSKFLDNHIKKVKENNIINKVA